MNEMTVVDGRGEGGELQIIPPNALAAIVGAEVDVQITTAKKYPRSITKFKQKAKEMACINEEVAASCFYTLPRGGKPITGPSIRLAEICATAWGNLRWGSRVIGDDGKIITAQGVCHDLECNVAGTIEIQRRVTNKEGNRFSDDMVVVTGNAAGSIARRNAILGVIPRAFVHEIEQEARKVAIGDAKTLVARRAEMIAYFGKMGITEERILKAIGVESIEQIGLEELGVLKGTATAIKEKTTTVDEVFPQAGPSPLDKLRSRGAAGSINGGEAKHETPKELPPTDPAQLALQDVANNIREMMRTAATQKELERTAGVVLKEARDMLGILYAPVLAEYQQRYRELGKVGVGAD
jgi:hypothetical protein